MPIQAFFDESGGKGQSRVFVIAGWLAEESEWTKFSIEWDKCLQSPPPIAYFKMREAARLSGEFNDLSEDARNGKLRALAKLIRKYAAGAIQCITDLDGFAATIGRAEKPFTDPYFWSFQVTIMALCFDLIDRCYREPAEVVFDEQVIFGPRAMRWYPVVRAMLTEPAERAVMPLKPIFGSDLAFPPLQASDMLAWLMRRTMETEWSAIEQWEDKGELGVSTRKPGDFSWIVEDELRFVEMSAYSQYLTRRRLEGIIKQVDQHVRSGFQDLPLSPELVQLYRDAVRPKPKRTDG